MRKITSKFTIACLALLLTISAQAQNTPHFFTSYTEFKEYYVSQSHGDIDLLFSRLRNYVTTVSEYLSSGDFINYPVELRSQYIMEYTSWAKEISVDLVKNDSISMKKAVYYHQLNMETRATELRRSGDFENAILAYQDGLKLVKDTHLEHYPNFWLAEMYIQKREFNVAMEYLNETKNSMNTFRTNPINNYIVIYTSVLEKIANYSRYASSKPLQFTRAAYEEYFDFGIQNDCHDVFVPSLLKNLNDYKKIMKELKLSSETYATRVNTYLAKLSANKVYNAAGVVVSGKRQFELYSDAELDRFEESLGTAADLEDAFYDNMLQLVSN